MTMTAAIRRLIIRLPNVCMHARPTMPAIWLGLAAAVGAQSLPGAPPALLVPLRVEIESRDGARPGQEITVPLRLSSGAGRIDGFSLVIAFDSTVLKFREAVRGPQAPPWTNFECRPIPQSERESIYPLCLLRVSARRDSSVESPFPATGTSGELAGLTFSIINDPRIACRSLPLQFFWRRCDDNIIYETPGFQPRYVRRVFEQTPPSTANTDGDADTLPAIIPDLPPPCVGWAGSIRDFAVDFVNGDIGVSCPDRGPDLEPPVGDLDGDGIPGGSTDLAILADLIVRRAVENASRKNIYGGILSYAPEGTPLTLGSLVRLANPVPPESLANLPPHGDILLLSIPPRSDTLKIYCQSTVRLGGLLLVFDVDGETSSPRPSPAAAGMVTDFLCGERSLRLLMFAREGRLLPAGIHALAEIPYAGTVRLRTAAAVDRFGHPIKMIYLGD